nr:hypothetical protein [Plantactinospora sp. KBS50]
MDESGQPGAATPGDRGPETGHGDEPTRAGNGWAPAGAAWADAGWDSRGGYPAEPVEPMPPADEDQVEPVRAGSWHTPIDPAVPGWDDAPRFRWAPEPPPDPADIERPVNGYAEEHLAGSLSGLRPPVAPTSAMPISAAPSSAAPFPAAPSSATPSSATPSSAAPPPAYVAEADGPGRNLLAFPTQRPAPEQGRPVPASSLPTQPMPLRRPTGELPALTDPGRRSGGAPGADPVDAAGPWSGRPGREADRDEAGPSRVEPPPGFRPQPGYSTESARPAVPAPRPARREEAAPPWASLREPADGARGRDPFDDPPDLDGGWRETSGAVLPISGAGAGRPTSGAGAGGPVSGAGGPVSGAERSTPDAERPTSGAGTSRPISGAGTSRPISGAGGARPPWTVAPLDEPDRGPDIAGSGEFPAGGRSAGGRRPGIPDPGEPSGAGMSGRAGDSPVWPPVSPASGRSSYLAPVRSGGRRRAAEEPDPAVGVESGFGAERPARPVQPAGQGVDPPDYPAPPAPALPAYPPSLPPYGAQRYAGPPPSTDAGRPSQPGETTASDPTPQPRSEPKGDTLPQRIPAEPDVPTVPEPPTVEPSAETPELARIATHLRRDEPTAPMDERPDGFDVQAILAAVRDVPGVRDGVLRTTPAGAHSLRLELADGADPADVSRQVARLLQERMGLAAAPQNLSGEAVAEGSEPPAGFRRGLAEAAGGTARSAAGGQARPTGAGPARPAAGGQARPASGGVSRVAAGGPARSATGGMPRSTTGGMPGSVAAGPSPSHRAGAGSSGGAMGDPGEAGFEGAGGRPGVAPGGGLPAGSVPAVPRRRRQGGPPRGRAAVGEPSAQGTDEQATGGVPAGTSYAAGQQLSSTERAPSRPLNPDGPPGPRVIIDHVQVSTFGLEASVEVSLSAARQRATGVTTGPAVDGYVLRLCAASAASAIGELLRSADGTPDHGRCFVEHAAVLPFGGCEVATVVVFLVCDGWVEQLAGSAVVSGDPRQAMVRATLAAVNRRLEALLA